MPPDVALGCFTTSSFSLRKFDRSLQSTGCSAPRPRGATGGTDRIPPCHVRTTDLPRPLHLIPAVCLILIAPMALGSLPALTPSLVTLASLLALPVFLAFAVHPNSVKFFLPVLTLTLECPWSLLFHSATWAHPPLRAS